VAALYPDSSGLAISLLAAAADAGAGCIWMLRSTLSDVSRLVRGAPAAARRRRRRSLLITLSTRFLISLSSPSSSSSSAQLAGSRESKLNRKSGDRQRVRSYIMELDRRLIAHRAAAHLS